VKILVAIPHNGERTRQFIEPVMAEYRAMTHDVDFVVMSDVPKSFGPGVDVLVGLPAKDPWSLPFTHKRYFADRVDDYDAFIYSEDDILVTQRNVDAFFEVTPHLRDDEIAGFFRVEKRPDGATSYDMVHAYYRWDSTSVRERGGELYAHFTNEHAAVYILTQDHLRRAIASGGFLVEPYQYRYDLLCTCATDPYTSCGMTKLICLTRLKDFEVHHIPNKYLDVYGVDEAEMAAQVGKLRALAHPSTNGAAKPMFEVETRMPKALGSKTLHVKIDAPLVDLLPASARDVLVVGCGGGRTEAAMIARGKRVTALPVDPVTGAGAARRGVEVVRSLDDLAGRTFDCLVFPDVLQLTPDPVALLTQYRPMLADGGTVIVSAPNLGDLKTRWRRLRRAEGYRDLDDFDRVGVHPVSRRLLERWLRRAGYAVERSAPVNTPKRQRLNDVSLGLFSNLLADRWLMTARASDGSGRNS